MREPIQSKASTASKGYLAIEIYKYISPHYISI